MSQISGSTRLDFFYDEDGSVIGFKYNNGIYLYRKNLQGDIIGIENSTGAQVVSYQYDSWGKVLSVGGTQGAALGTLNPFRYRGYYYDEESGLYSTMYEPMQTLIMYIYKSSREWTVLLKQQVL